jgi:hypothetical protein
MSRCPIPRPDGMPRCRRAGRGADGPAIRRRRVAPRASTPPAARRNRREAARRRRNRLGRPGRDGLRRGRHAARRTHRPSLRARVRGLHAAGRHGGRDGGVAAGGLRRHGRRQVDGPPRRPGRRRTRRSRRPPGRRRHRPGRRIRRVGRSTGPRTAYGRRADRPPGPLVRGHGRRGRGRLVGLGGVDRAAALRRRSPLRLGARQTRRAAVHRSRNPRRHDRGSVRRGAAPRRGESPPGDVRGVPPAGPRMTAARVVPGFAPAGGPRAAAGRPAHGWAADRVHPRCHPSRRAVRWTAWLRGAAWPAAAAERSAVGSWVPVSRRRPRNRPARPKDLFLPAWVFSCPVSGVKSSERRAAEMPWDAMGRPQRP